MSFTHKQVAIVDAILKGNGTDPATRVFSPVDLDQLLERLDYKPTKQSIQFSIRALIRHGLIEKGPRIQRRGRSRVTLLATNYARQVMTAIPNPGMTATISGSGATLPASAASPFNGDNPSDTLSDSVDPLFAPVASLDEVIEEM